MQDQSFRWHRKWQRHTRVLTNISCFRLKVNLLILVRVIKEMNTMQPSAGEGHNHQIR